ncbi:MAG: hypothetical protein LUG57_09765 [Oscillospiraceae bacterium]|nr:hypothetical protein [Oscillospiraceae bacterium]
MKKRIAFLLALVFVLSMATPVLATSEASGEAAETAETASGEMSDTMPLPAGSYEPETLAITAGISVINGAVTVDEGIEGEITDSSISGAYVSYNEIGDWDGSEVFGQSGVILASDEEGLFTVGGEEDVYEIDGEGYNTVIILNNDDAEEENALSGSDVRDYQDVSEGYEGVGLYVGVSDVVIDNTYIYTAGYKRSGIRLTTSLNTAVIKNSTVIAVGSEGEGSSAPGLICMYASSRPTLIESSGTTYFYNDDVISSDWGAFSLDGCYNANVYIVGSYSVNSVGGYSIYSLGRVGQENTAYFYGSYAASAQFGSIVCAAGFMYVGDLDDASDEALACADGVELETVLEDGWSYIGGVTSAITMQADSSSADMIGIFNAHHTILDSANVVDLDGNELIDTLEVYASDYLDDLAVGASYFFLKSFHGTAISIRSENVDLTLDDCIVESGNGVAVQSVVGYDTNASGIMVADGDEYYGINTVIKDMELTGDILHQDYQRKMDLALENVTLTGAVVSGTRAGWVDYITTLVAENWSDECDELGLDADTIIATLCPDETYETVWGVRMSIDGDSTWTVTGDSSLYSLTVAEGAVIEAADGQELEIYVDCELNNEDLTYDYTTGTQVDSLAAGEYAGVVILVK